MYSTVTRRKCFSRVRSMYSCCWCQLFVFWGYVSTIKKAIFAYLSMFLEGNVLGGRKFGQSYTRRAKKTHQPQSKGFNTSWFNSGQGKLTMHLLLEIFRKTRGFEASRAASTIPGLEDYQSRFKRFGQRLHEPGFQTAGEFKFIEQLRSWRWLVFDCCDIYKTLLMFW